MHKPDTWLDIESALVQLSIILLEVKGISLKKLAETSEWCINFDFVERTPELEAKTGQLFGEVNHKEYSQATKSNLTKAKRRFVADPTRTQERDYKPLPLGWNPAHFIKNSKYHIGPITEEQYLSQFTMAPPRNRSTSPKKDVSFSPNVAPTKKTVRKKPFSTKPAKSSTKPAKSSTKPAKFENNSDGKIKVHKTYQLREGD
jgi:hypothetical protein